MVKLLKTDNANAVMKSAKDESYYFTISILLEELQLHFWPYVDGGIYILPRYLLNPYYY